MDGIDMGGKRAYQCQVCGKVHLATEDTFFTFYGNVTIGESGGVIGNNLDENNRVVRAMQVCRDGSLTCLRKILFSDDFLKSEGPVKRDATLGVDPADIEIHVLNTPRMVRLPGKEDDQF